ncbi:Glyoxalase/Bleomycin resistance protein/Dioxygenase superfamily protein [Nannocystis exedens]|uniref:Glyoxalase/Bleomycin resistance protein/Dioxygenase superfamily protein n=2 Tax=Nannocystis exedens TaxID=54 RepID=A0A1I2F397_9BACT|nr:glyoxalase [Nannocystis exedens]SFE98980.1 Glyoxalase/Bleomycin resistance protein/Dioxygenase superfamily protein [Nannocystis exedens]
MEAVAQRDQPAEHVVGRERPHAWMLGPSARFRKIEEASAGEAWQPLRTMIQRLSHTTIYVLDQDRARAFYTEKLGFEVRHDERMGEFRWLTVGPKGQPTSSWC